MYIINFEIDNNRIESMRNGINIESIYIVLSRLNLRRDEP